MTRSNEEIIEVYEQYVHDTRNRELFRVLNNARSLRVIIRYLVTEKSKLTREEVCEKVGSQFWREHKLLSLVSRHFRGSTHAVLEHAFPGMYKPWDLQRTPKGYWNTETGVKATKWLIEEQLKWSQEEVIEKIDRDVFREHNLGGMLVVCFDSSPFRAVLAAYPNIKPWDFNRRSRNFWTLEYAKQAMKWMIEEQLQWDEQQIKDNIRYGTFKQYGLTSLLRDFCEGDIPEALSVLYPGKFGTYDLKYKPGNHWNLKTGVEATRWMIEEKLKWSREDICSKLGSDTFKENNLYGMLNVCFEYSPYKALEAAYPGEYRPWELKQAPKGFWTENTIHEAVRWLIEDKLGWSPDKAMKELAKEHFKEYGLSGMLAMFFGNNPMRALDKVYSGNTVRCKLTRNKRNTQTKKHGSNGSENFDTNPQQNMLRSLVEDEWKWTREEVCRKLSADLLRQNGFGKLLDVQFNGQVSLLLDALYPGVYKPWEVKNVPFGFWKDSNNRQSAIKWLVEEKLRLSLHDPDFQRPSWEQFREFGLQGLICSHFGGNITKALQFAYPHVDAKVLRKRGPSRQRNTPETIRANIQRAIEIDLGWSREDICAKLNTPVLHSIGLKSILGRKFNYSVFALLDFAYPGEYKPWELQKVPRNFWASQKNQADAIKWLVQDKLRLDPWTAKSNLSTRDFENYGLRHMIGRVFNGNISLALSVAYPHIYGEKKN